MSYSNVVTSISKQPSRPTQPTVHKNYPSSTFNNTSTHVPKTLAIEKGQKPPGPMSGLGGGITNNGMDKEKIQSLEQDMIMLKQALAKNSEAVANIDLQIQNKLNHMDEKIENSVATMMQQMESKIEHNNVAL
jgi:hypothetical protein